MDSAKGVTLKDLIENRQKLTEGSYYCFTGIVENVENKIDICYKACNICTGGTYLEEGNRKCKRCVGKTIETSPRYKVNLNVVQGDYNARITMFDDTTVAYVGCSVEEYITSLAKIYTHISSS